MINIELGATAFCESDSLVQMVVKILGKRSIDWGLRRIMDRDRSIKAFKILCGESAY